MTGRSDELTGSHLDSLLDSIENDVSARSESDLHQAGEIEREALRLGRTTAAARARLLRVSVAPLFDGNLPGAVDELTQMVAWATENGERLLLARSYSALSVTYRHLGALTTALIHAERATSLLRSTDPAYSLIWFRVRLATVLAELGSYQDAMSMFDEAIKLATQLGEVELRKAALNNLAFAQYGSGQLDQAQDTISAMRRLAEENQLDLECSDLDTIAQVAAARGDLEAAEEASTACLRLHRDSKQGDVGLPEFLLTRAGVLRRLGRLGDAEDVLDRCLTVWSRLGVRVLPVVHRERADIRAAQGDFRAAYEGYRRFVESSQAQLTEARSLLAKVREAMERTERAEAAAEMFREQARRDWLTGLYNRRYVEEQLDVRLVDPARSRLSAALIDLDRFKAVNDTFGHQAGDRVLVDFSDRLRSAVLRRFADALIGRLGGEEFLIVTSMASAPELAQWLGEFGAAHREQGFGAASHARLTFSAGVSSTDTLLARGEPVVTGTELLAMADRALYRAKEAGRDRVEL